MEWKRCLGVIVVTGGLLLSGGVHPDGHDHAPERIVIVLDLRPSPYEQVSTTTGIVSPTIFVAVTTT